jgi:molybdopterin-guanine dinucleotide biosynthesis protein A
MGASEKAFAPLAGKPLLQWAIARAAPQVDELLINANGDPERFSAFGRTVIADSVQGYLGPLAGIFTGLAWMKENRASTKWLASFACDTPFFPHDMVARLIAAAERENALAAVAETNARHHPVFAVWNGTIAHGDMNQAANRKMEDFIRSLPHVFVAFEAGFFDPFFNINTPDDLVRAETIVAKHRTI